MFKKGKKKGKIFENLGENVQNLKIFWKRSGDCVLLLHAKTARKGPNNLDSCILDILLSDRYYI